MARARRMGFPNNTPDDAIIAIPNRRITRAPLVSVHAFITEDDRKRDDGSYYTVKQVKLSLAFDSHEVQTRESGEVVTDDDGNSLPHLIIDGFVTLSGHAKSNFGGKILPAFGFEGPTFFDDEGNLLDEVMETLEVEFGTNGQGVSYAGYGWEELPVYERGGKLRKGEIEVPVRSLRLAGYELIGREVDLALTIKDGYNRISAYLLPADFTSLDEEGKDSAKPAPKGKAKAPAKKAAGKGEEPKHVTYIRNTLANAGIEGGDALTVLREVIGEPMLASISSATRDQALAFREFVLTAEEGGDEGGKELLNMTLTTAAENAEFPPDVDLPF